MFKLHTIIASIFLVSCTSPNKKDYSLHYPDDIQEGDVVFRSGKGLSSEAILYADNNGDFSHVGIVVDTLGKLMVVHAVPDELDFEGDVARVKLDSLNEFYSVKKADKGAVCRPRNNALAKKTAKLAAELYKRNILFDNYFDVSDTSKMYCTELLLFVYSKCGVKLTESDGHRFYLPMLKHKVFLPSDIYNSKQLKLIKQF